MNMRWKVILLPLIIFTLVIGGAYYWVHFTVAKPKDVEPAVFVDLAEEYGKDEDIMKAMELFQTGIRPLEVITAEQWDMAAENEKDENGQSKLKYSLIFDGLPDAKLMEKLLDILTRHKAKATFFIEGANAINEPESVNAIKQAGHGVGNYTLVGMSGIEDAPDLPLIGSFVRTQKILRRLTGNAPKLFRAPKSVYTYRVLSCAAASGLSFAVKESLEFPIGRLTNFRAASNFADEIQPGAVISIQIGTPIEEIPRLRREIYRGKPAEDKQPTIKDDRVIPERPSPNSLSRELDYFLTAMEGRAFVTEMVDNFRAVHYVPEKDSIADIANRRDSGEITAEEAANLLENLTQTGLVSEPTADSPAN